MQTLDQIESNLELAGFREYSSNKPIHHEHAVSRWELKVCNENGRTKYFIHAFLYKKYGSNRHSDPGGTIEFEAVLYQEGTDDEWMILQLHGSTVGSALLCFSGAYISLDCELDRHNN